MGGKGLLLSGGDDEYERSSVLADPRQRQLLSILLDRSHPMTERDLSLQIAVRETGKEPAAVSEEELTPVQVDLYHRCLPKLAAVGLIERCPEGILASESLVSWNEDTPGPDLESPDYPLWEAAGTLLARHRTRELICIIADQAQTLSLTELATELEDRGPDSWTDAQRERESTLPSRLHHLHLPKLAEAGLIEYDHDDKTITRTPTLMTLADQIDLDNG